MAELKRGNAFIWAFKLVDETDFATPEHSKTPTVKISKDGGAFATVTNNASAIEIDADAEDGWYKVTLTGTETTADVVVLKVTAANCAQTDEVFYLPTYTITSETAVSSTSPVASGGDITLYYGDDYESAETITITVTDFDRYDVDGETGTFRLLTRAAYEKGDDTAADLSLDASFAQTGTTVTITVDIEASDYAGLETGPPKPDDHYHYQCKASPGSKAVTVADGNCTIRKTLGAAS